MATVTRHRTLIATPSATAIDGERAAAPRRLVWPLPAVLAWAAGWGGLLAAEQLGAGPVPAWGLGCTLALLLAWRCDGLWRRSIAALGFPLSALATGWAGEVPAWAWGLAVLPLLLLYPVRAWRDAPFFPTPGGGLQGLDAAVGLPLPQQVLDAGCGLGHGLRELQALWPKATVHGVEWSRPLAWAAAWRCPEAKVRRGDMWAASWKGYDVVYLFQRPESMARAWAKACAELAPGSCFVSLEFPVPGVSPSACLNDGLPDAVHDAVHDAVYEAVQGGRRRPVWLYRVPAHSAAGTQ